LHLIQTAARELSLAARSVCTRLGLATGPILLAGGMFRAVPRLVPGMASELSDRMPGAQVRRLDDEPALGAVRLALAAASGTLVIPSYGDHA
jgi:hypothetical protein